MTGVDSFKDKSFAYLVHSVLRIHAERSNLWDQFFFLNITGELDTGTFGL